MKNATGFLTILLGLGTMVLSLDLGSVNLFFAGIALTVLGLAVLYMPER